MNKLFLLALVGLVLTISLALPFGEDDDVTSNGLKLQDAERFDKQKIYIFLLLSLLLTIGPLDYFLCITVVMDSFNSASVIVITFV